MFANEGKTRRHAGEGQRNNYRRFGAHTKNGLEDNYQPVHFEWCPVCKNTRTMMTVVNGAVYLMLPRAA